MKSLDVIKYKNRDLILAYLRKYGSSGNAIYYEDLEKELHISKDYLCQLLRPLKQSNIIQIEDIGGESIHSPRKMIHLTEFGKFIVNELAKLWLTNTESEWLQFSDVFSQDYENSTQLFEKIVSYSKPEIIQIISKRLSNLIVPKILENVLVNDIVSEVIDYLTMKIEQAELITQQLIQKKSLTTI